MAASISGATCTYEFAAGEGFLVRDGSIFNCKCPADSSSSDMAEYILFRKAAREKKSTEWEKNMEKAKEVAKKNNWTITNYRINGGYCAKCVPSVKQVALANGAIQVLSNEDVSSKK